MLSRSFEICFLVDLCVSMVSWLETFKKAAIPFIQKIKKQNMWMTIRVAFIGYRNTLHFSPYEIIEFTENLRMLQEKLLVIKASGAPGCKNLNDVYHYAEKLEWITENRLIIHIGDSPNHGLKYHEPDYPDIFPIKTDHHSPLELHVKRIAEDKIKLTVFRLNTNFDKTLYIIEEKYNRNCVLHDGFHIINMIGIEYRFNDDIECSIAKLFRSAR